MNRVELKGGMVRDPELRYLPSGTAVCEFTLAVNGARYDGKAREQVVTTQFIACQLWGARAEEFADESQKGDEVYVVGELDQTTFEKADGKKESKTRVNVVMWTVVRSRSASGGPGQISRSDVPTDEEPF